MTNINLTSDSSSGFLESDFNQIKGLLQDGTYGLGGNLKLGGNAITEDLTAGEALSAGDLCYLSTDGMMWKADASAESTSITLLAIATETISANATGTFLLFGSYTTSGLTAGDIMYVSETAGAMTNTAPSTSGSVVRIVGYALSTTVLFFNPDNSYITN